MHLATKCINPPCWAPTPPPAWTWLIYLAVAIVAGLIIYLDWRNSPAREPGRARTAFVVWLGSVIAVAVVIELLTLYTYSQAPK